MRKIFSVALIFMMLLASVGCSADKEAENKPTNPTEATQESTLPENDVTEPSESETTENVEDKTEDAFGMLAISVDDVNEGYNITAESASNIWNGSFNRDEIDGKFVELLSNKTDWGNEYSAGYDLSYGLPRDIVISIEPQKALPAVSEDDIKYDYDTTFLYVREFTINYFDFILKAGSNQFDRMTFDYKNDMNIYGSIGNFEFFQYDFSSFKEKGLYDGDYYQVMVYATTMEKANISFNFNEETQTFTVESDKEISNIFIEVTTNNNDLVETVCGEDVKTKINNQ